MCANKNFPQDWQIIFFAAIMFFLCLQGCKTTKEMTQVKATEETKIKATEESKSTAETETKTDTRTTAETNTVEECDTSVSVWVNLSDTESVIQEVRQILVPVKFKRTINKKEFTNQLQEKKEQVTAVSDKKDIVSSKTNLQVKEKTVERTGLPWWGIGLIILILLAGVAVLLWRMKVF